jgi:hypothetical protein
VTTLFRFECTRDEIRVLLDLLDALAREPGGDRDSVTAYNLADYIRTETGVPK